VNIALITNWKHFSVVEIKKNLVSQSCKYFVCSSISGDEKEEKAAASEEVKKDAPTNP